MVVQQTVESNVPVYTESNLYNSPEMVVPQTAESNIPVYTKSKLPCGIAVEYESHIRR